MGCGIYKPHLFRKPHKIKEKGYRTSNQGSGREIFLKLRISFTIEKDTIQARTIKEVER